MDASLTTDTQSAPGQPRPRRQPRSRLIGFNVDPASLDAAAVEAKTGGGHLPSTQGFLLGVIPDSVVGAFAENTLLAVLFFSCMFSIALAQFGGRRSNLVLQFIDQLTHVIFRLIGYVMNVAPIGAFGAMAFISVSTGFRPSGPSASSSSPATGRASCSSGSWR
jgi:aerobic C4-dicarboxylate transport protein